MENKVNEVLTKIINNIKGLTDVYIYGDDKISVRAYGELGYNFFGENDSTNIISISNIMLKDYLTEQLGRFNLTYREFEEKRNFDFRTSLENKSFRVNASISKGKLLLIFRLLNSEIIELDELGIDLHYLKGILNVSQGLFLVSGPTGSGKSTTLSSIINFYNKKYNNHIITLENPIEQIYKDETSVVHQMELGDDFLTFEAGMENILRQDPDIIVIGEIRSRETLDIALRLAETGHLVFGTIHGKGANGVIGKIIRMFENEKQIAGMLADVLVGILYQQKFTLDNKKTIICLETLYNTDEIQAGFKQGKYNDFKSNMQTSYDNYMTTMEQYLENYLNKEYKLIGREYKMIQDKISGL